MLSRQLTPEGQDARALARLESIGPTDPDSVIALRLADYFTATRGGGGRFYLSVVLPDRNALFPLPISIRRGRVRLFITKDRAAAVKWAMRAALLGYAVFRRFSRDDEIAGGFGTMAEIRERARERSAA